MGMELGGIFVITSVVMIILWFVQRRTGDAGIVDVAWAWMIGVFALAFGIPDYVPRSVIVGILGAIWAFRLALHLFVDRILLVTEEDGRYRMLREKWGEKTQRYMFWFYQVQAFFVLAFVLAFCFSILL